MGRVHGQGPTIGGCLLMGAHPCILLAWLVNRLQQTYGVTVDTVSTARFFIASVSRMPKRRRITITITLEIEVISVDPCISIISSVRWTRGSISVVSRVTSRRNVKVTC